MANASVLKFEYNDVTVHLYWPPCCGSTELIIKVDDLEILCVLKYHSNKNSPNPVAEQVNATLWHTVAVNLLGLIVTTGGESKVAKHYFNIIA